MGKKDSSKTRVQPMISALLEKEGVEWLSQLLLLGSRAQAVGVDRLRAVGNLLNSPPRSNWFEWRADAPKDYLAKLLTCRDRLSLASQLNPKIFANAPEVNEQRKKLLVGDDTTVIEALQHLEAGKTRSGRGRWWVLEGRTAVDCALFAEKATIFIEGKRTERKLTRSVAWDPLRNQVFRNLDVLRESSERADKDFFMLLVVERDSNAEKEAAELDNDATIAMRSWPHLVADVASSLFDKHYLGYTTWQDIAAAFEISIQ